MSDDDLRRKLSDGPPHEVEDKGLPCMAKGETYVDGALLPVACDLWHGHPATHFDEFAFTFWPNPDEEKGEALNERA